MEFIAEIKNKNNIKKIQKRTLKFKSENLQVNISLFNFIENIDIEAETIRAHISAQKT